MGRGGGALPQASRTGPVRRGRVRIEEGIPLARMTTVGIGGPARALARPRTLARARRGAGVGRRAGAGRAADRARLQPARGRRRGGRARRPARGRAGGGRGARDGARRRRRRSECRVPPSRPRLRPRGLRVRLRDPRHRGRRCAHERGRLRQRLEGDSRAGARRRRDRRSLVHQRGTRALVPPLRPRPGAGGGRGRVPARRPRRRRDQGDGRRHAVPAKGHAADQQAHVRKRVQESGPRARGRTDDRALRPEGASHRRRRPSRHATGTSSRTPGERPRARLSN